MHANRPAPTSSSADPRLGRLAEGVRAELDRARRFPAAGKALPPILVFYKRDLELRSVMALDFGPAEEKIAALDAAGDRASPGFWAVLSLDDAWVSIEDTGPEGAKAGESPALPDRTSTQDLGHDPASSQSEALCGTVLTKESYGLLLVWRYHRDAAGLSLFADRPMLLETGEVAHSHLLGRLFAGTGKHPGGARGARRRNRRERPTLH